MQMKKSPLKFFLSTLVILFLYHFTYSQIELDGVSSASQRLKINKIYVYPTQAIIKWWDYYNNGEKHMLYWGKSPNNYTDSMDLKPFNRQSDVYDTIKNLTPGTRYYCEIYRTYKSKGASVHTTFNFTTPDETSVSTMLNLRDYSAQEKIKIFSIKGEVVSSLTTSTLTPSFIKNYLSKRAQKGVYIIVSKNQSEVRKFSVLLE